MQIGEADLYVPSSSEDIPYSNSSDDEIPNKKTKQTCSVFDKSRRSTSANTFCMNTENTQPVIYDITTKTNNVQAVNTIVVEDNLETNDLLLAEIGDDNLPDNFTWKSSVSFCRKLWHQSALCSSYILRACIAGYLFFCMRLLTSWLIKQIYMQHNSC